MLRQPDFIVDLRLLGDDVTAPVESGKKESNRNCVNCRDIKPHPLALGFVDPYTAFELAEQLGGSLFWLVAGARFSLNFPGVASVQQFRSNQAEVECVGNLQHKLAIFVVLLFFFFEPLAAVAFRLVLAFIDDLLNLLLFLLRIVGRERLVVLGNEPFDGLAVNFQNLERPGLDLLHVAATVEHVLFFPLDVGVIAKALFILEFFFLGVTQQFAYLFLRNRSGSIRH